MTSSLPGRRDLPESQYDLSTYWGRVRHSMDLADPSTLFVSSAGLEQAKRLVSEYKQEQIKDMNPELWRAKKVVDSTLHPDDGKPVFLPFRMSCFVISNLVVTAGMLTPGLSTAGTLGWQITNQSLNVAINYSNANKTSPLSTEALVTSYALAVSASCGVALGLNAIVPRLRRLSPALRATLSRLIPFAAVASAGALNVFLMRGEEMRTGIDVYPALKDGEESSDAQKSLGKSKKAAKLAVGETAFSRVMNSTPIMVLPPLILQRLQQQDWLRTRPRLVLPVNLGLILTTSIFALPLALAVFPQRQQIEVSRLEEEFVDRLGKDSVDRKPRPTDAEGWKSADLSSTNTGWLPAIGQTFENGDQCPGDPPSDTWSSILRTPDKVTDRATAGLEDRDSNALRDPCQKGPQISSIARLGHALNAAAS